MAKVPGMSKSKASFEDKTLHIPRGRDLALSDTRVRDEDYDYTKDKFPGYIGNDPNLTRAEMMHEKR